MERRQFDVKRGSGGVVSELNTIWRVVFAAHEGFGHQKFGRYWRFDVPGVG